MDTISHRFAVTIMACLAASCSAEYSAVDPAVYEAELQEWRASRLEHLRGPTGYLNLVGLYWLESTSVRIGSAADNDIVFPEKAAEHIGVIRAMPDGALLEVAANVDVRSRNEPVTKLLMEDDTSANPVTVTHGALAWSIIKRDGNLALRLRDFEHPAIDAFGPIESYPIDLDLRVKGTLKPFEEPRILNVNTTIEGLGYRPRSPGTVAFEIDGKVHELEAYESGDELFFVFGDLTSGRETYPAGRFLYAAAPDHRGETILDFNRAYSPPCAFNEFATCPVASPRNRLSVRIEAGEKYDAGK
jgi:uncharacterized protein (DUF1684 family)